MTVTLFILQDRIHEAKLKEPFPCCIDKHHPQHSSGNQPSASAGPSASSSAKLKKRRDTFGGFEPGFLLKKVSTKHLLSNCVVNTEKYLDRSSYIRAVRSEVLTKNYGPNVLNEKILTKLCEI